MTRPPEHIALSSSDIDDIHKLFDTLIAYMGDRWTSANLYATKDASGGVNCGITCTDRANNSFTYSERIIGPRVAVSPPGANLGPGAAQQFTAAVTNSDGSAVSSPTIQWTVQPGANGGGVIDATGLYTAPASIAASGNDTVVALYVEGGSSAAVSVALHS